ncbi:MAG: prolyl oligopeptidase family serine peptidase [Phycisphaerae bacterium]|nr:prolyl oligopeptidase family serine peptidase [Phycisphaerae bacterium]
MLLGLVLITPGAVAQGSRADYERAAAHADRFRAVSPAPPPRPEWLSDSVCWYRTTDRGGTPRSWLVDAAKGTKEPLCDPASLALAAEKLLSLPPAERGPVIERAALVDGRLAVLVRGAASPLVLDRASGEWSAWDAATPNPFRGTGRAAPRRSRDGGGDTTITFINKTAGNVRMFWIDGGGRRRPYATIAPGESHSQHTFAGHAWVAVDADGQDLAFFEGEDAASVAEIGPMIPAQAKPEEAQAPTRPKPAAFISEHNVFIDTPDGPIALTEGATERDGYARLTISPDGTKAAAIRTRRPEERKVYYVESSPADGVQPKLHHYNYAKPGDDLPHARAALFDLAGRREIPVSDSLMPTPWSLTEPRWAADSSRFTLLYNQRGHRVMRLLAIDASTGDVTPIINEECPTFFDYAAKTFLHFTSAGEVIWMSERDGWNHLYLIDAATRDVKNPITRGEWVVRGVDRVDDDAGHVWFRACGIHPAQDPYHVHHARVNFDGTGLTILTEGDGTHEVTFSPSRDFLIDTYSRADLPPVTELRLASDGALILELERSSAAELLSAGWLPPQRFTATGRDGTTDIHGLIHRPTNFDPTARYPVIEAIYAGPHDAHVSKRFRVQSGVGHLTELGFIVVQIDGMGTNWRSKKFHDVAWKNLKDAGFLDRIAWIKAAAAAHPEMDLDNNGRGVGIFGGSAGGQNALAALLWHGDFYKAAAADCGCHDNRMDKVWWNELWMSWPVGPWYEESSNVVNAHRMPDGCKLLLTVGEMDENVDPASTMQVAAALIKAGKDFELLVLPGMGHGAGESPYGRRKRQDFFVRNLMEREPRW